MSKRRKYKLIAGWRNFATPDIKLHWKCPDCGRYYRAKSAKKLLAGKKDAKIFASCACRVALYRPDRFERIALLRRHNSIGWWPKGTRYFDIQRVNRSSG